MACKAPEFPRRLLYTRQHRTDPSLVVSQQTSTDSGASLSHFFNDAGVVGAWRIDVSYACVFYYGIPVCQLSSTQAGDI